MRIIRGEFVGKALIEPKSMLTRPTSDKVRQAIFNILDHHPDMLDLKGSIVLDIFAGTGALGFEALSRGALETIFVDNQRAAVLSLYNTISNWNIKHRTQVLAQDVITMSKASKPADFIFCDPPYRKELVNLSITHLYQRNWIANHTTIIAEMHKQDDLNLKFPVKILQEKRYGDTKVIFFNIS